MSVAILVQHAVPPFLRSVNDFNWEASQLKKKGKRGEFYMGHALTLTDGELQVVWKYWATIEDKTYSVRSVRVTINKNDAVEEPFDTIVYDYEF